MSINIEINRKIHDKYKYQGLLIVLKINKNDIFKKIFHGGYILPFNITTSKIYQIEIIYSSKYNYQSLN